MDIFLSDDNKAVIALTVIGQARNYIPYLTIALQRAGEQGIGRKRTPFAMEKITHEGKTFDYSIENVEKKSLFWPDAIGMQNLGTIILDSPCRIKKAAHYLQTIYVDDLLLAAQRHMYILDRLYGDGRFSIQELPNHSSIPVDQHWIDQNYYSSRQHTHMKIGGVVGKIELKNSLDQYSYELLEACRLFHVGKNISMGLGRILLMRR
ncbi:MAG: CRISPR system precrRNA processing endoribonuclease RAMP protein Cas6 [Spirochaetia bacterium]|jgi:hypothetical protein|nr:CRISPR system precrRNA processing endoribonuclease RAMP protein Cas6 [Spirochaetia bacterium]